MIGAFYGIVFLICTHVGNAMVVIKNGSPNRERFSYFDTEMFKALSESEPRNLFVSPVSIKLLLALIMEGAGGSTAEEIRLALRLPKEKNSIRKEFDTWLSLLQMKESSNNLKVASHIFLSDSYNIMGNYRTTLKTVYDSDITTVKFSDPKETSQAINDWVSQKTSNVIPTVVKEDQIEASAKLMLISAVYFKGIWSVPFTRDKRLRCFYNSPETCQKTVMMSDTGNYDLGYIDKLDAQALRIPYKGDKYSMLILLPSKRSRIDELTRDLIHVSIPSILSEMSSQEVFVQIPNFEISYEGNLVDSLKKIKLNELFSDAANFSNIFNGTGTHLAVDRVFHSAKIKVNEGGTEAAAATGALFMPLIGGTTTSFVANHPFLFFIIDSVDNSILFAGKLMTPTEAELPENVYELLPEIPSKKISSTESSMVNDAAFIRLPSVRPVRPKFRSIKGAFPQGKQSGSNVPSATVNYFYSLGQVGDFLQRQPGAVQFHKSHSEKQPLDSEPVRQMKNVNLKRDGESVDVPQNLVAPTSKSDSWRHHILFFS